MFLVYLFCVCFQGVARVFCGAKLLTHNEPSSPDNKDDITSCFTHAFYIMEKVTVAKASVSGEV